ncbi:MAG: DegQ family serine endoprotease [Pseudomonadota bacterium]
MMQKTLIALALGFSSVAAVLMPAAAKDVPQSQSQVQLSYAPVVKQVSPAVVNIYTKRRVETRNRFADDPFFRRFFGEGFNFGMPRERVDRSLGSGVIVSGDGLIVTNFHVAGKADEIKVVLNDRREFDAEIVLNDERTDLTILRIDAGKSALPTVTLGDSDALEVGDLVLAIGNPFGVGQTVTSGIISALARTGVGVTDYQFFIQTDAAINPGNSGGALVDVTGRLIGVNTAIYSRSGGSNGIGFAIPVAMVQSLLTAAEGDGKVRRPWLGVDGQAVTGDIAAALGLDRPTGVLIDTIFPGSPADKAKLRSGDIVLSVDSVEINDSNALRFRVGTMPVGKRVRLAYLRDGKERAAAITLAEPPSEPTKNETVLGGRGFLTGVKVANLSPAYADELRLPLTTSGVIVTALDQRAPARRLRLLRPGDILKEVAGKRIEAVKDLVSLIKTADPGATTYEILRNDRLIRCRINANGRTACRS